MKYSAGLYYQLYRRLRHLAFATCGCERCLFSVMYIQSDFGSQETAFSARTWFERHVQEIAPCPNGLVLEFSTLNVLLSTHGKELHFSCGRCGGGRDSTLTVSAREVRTDVVEITMSCDRCGVGEPAFIDTRVVDEIANLWGGAIRDETLLAALRTAWPRKKGA